MNRFILLAAALLLTGGLSFAQTGTSVKPGAVTAPAASFAGKIQVVSEADAAKGTKSEIVVAGEDKAVKTFLVKAATTIYDSTGKPLTLKDLKAADLVKVNYKTSAEGVLEAAAIYQTK